MKKDTAKPDPSEFAVVDTSSHTTLPSSITLDTVITFSSHFEADVTSIAFSVFFTAEGTVSYDLSLDSGELVFTIKRNGVTVTTKDNTFSVPSVKDEFTFIFTRDSVDDDISFKLTCTY